jgi:TolB protein
VRFFLLLALFSYVSSTLAALEITIIKKKNNAIPIVVSDFNVQNGTEQGGIIPQIIRDNLNRSGEFNANRSHAILSEKLNFEQWKNKGIDAIVVGKLTKISQKVFNIEIKLLDTFSKKTLYTSKNAVHTSGVRRVAHFLSDQIYQAILGTKGGFDTRLTYVSVTGYKHKQYKLEISDADAQNPQTVLTSNSPILSPVWSPDQSKIAYVSFRNNRSEVFIQYPFVRRKTHKLPIFDGIASSPSWHPNGKSLLITLSKNGNKDLYNYDVRSRNLTRITTNKSIDTEGSYSPDGKHIVFTSNRSGQVQIFIKNLNSGKVNRVTFEGRYNAKAVYAPDAKSLALVHRTGKDYRIALLDLKTKDLTILSTNTLDESPFFSPNGDMIIFATNQHNKGTLSVVSVKGRETFKLTSKIGEVREPNWSQYSK